jgi:hypothetical protein
MNENIVTSATPVFCDSCGGRIFRVSYHINSKVFCNRCVKDKFSVNVNEKEEKDGSDSES